MTTKTKHTPGPFKVVEILANNAPSQFGIWPEKQNTFGNEPLAVFKHKADAELFIAAPELLEALERAEALADSIPFESCTGKDSCNCQRCLTLRSARAAIAKAKGEL